MIEIEKNVPIPNRGERNGYRLTMRKMDVGDSAVFYGVKGSIAATANFVFGAGKYMVRKEKDGGISVWRIE